MESANRGHTLLGQQGRTEGHVGLRVERQHLRAQRLAVAAIARPPATSGTPPVVRLTHATPAAGASPVATRPSALRRPAWRIRPVAASAIRPARSTSRCDIPTSTCASPLPTFREGHY